jgi:type IV pilus assembly protein PilA
MEHQEEGFTLIELLVVMVIVGLLAAIAIPSFLSQKGHAYKTAMKADLSHLVVSENSFSVSNDAFTADLASLTVEGFRSTDGVTAHVKLVDSQRFVACTKHVSVAEWLVYDSGTSQITSSPADCA